MSADRPTIVFLTAAAFLIAHCGAELPCDSTGNDSSCVGGGCLAVGACVVSCETGGEFPGGMCTAPCWGAEECPNGSTCVFVGDLAVCLPTCDSSNDCRSGYACERQIPVNTGPNAELVQADVCIGSAEPWPKLM